MTVRTSHPGPPRTPTPSGSSTAVRVDAPARLQLGLLDVRGDLGRLFGGIGVALANPRTVVEAIPATGLSVHGDDAERAAHVALGVLGRWGLPGATLRIRAAIPAHAGLGSGTQLALAVAAGIAEAHGLPRELPRLVEATGRGGRSGVGSWTFEGGGFVVDGGHRVERGPDQRLAVSGVHAEPGAATGAGDLPPRLFHHRMPPNWRCVVAVPPHGRGLSGLEERDAFRRLVPPDAGIVGEIAHVVLLGVLPAVVEAELAAFGRAVTRLQQLVGDCFAPIQGSRFAGPETADLVERLLDAGAAGAGQSSWGPAVYAFVEGDEAAARLAARARGWLGRNDRVFATPFDDQGARVERVPLAGWQAGP